MKPFSNMTKNSRQKRQYLKYKKSFQHEIKSIFSSFLKGIQLSKIVSRELTFKHETPSPYIQVPESRYKSVFNKLKYLIRNYKCCLTNNKTKNILKNNWKSSNFYVLSKVLKSKKIIDEIDKYNNICVNIEPSKCSEGRIIAGCPNSSPQSITGFLAKSLTTIVLYLKIYLREDQDFLRKSLYNINYPCVLIS